VAAGPVLAEVLALDRIHGAAEQPRCVALSVVPARIDDGNDGSVVNILVKF